MPDCFSFSSNRIGDCRLSRAHKPNFREESHQQSQYLLLRCKEVKYEHKYDISGLSALYVQICLLLLQKDLGSLAIRLKDPKSLPKTLVFCRTKTNTAKVYSFLRKAASSPDAVSLYHASLTDKTKTCIYNTFSSSGSVIRCLCATVAFGMVSSK